MAKVISEVARFVFALNHQSNHIAGFECSYVSYHEIVVKRRSHVLEDIFFAVSV